MKKIGVLAVFIVLVLFVVAIGISINREKVYTVTFDSVGGSLVKSQMVSEGNTATKPINPVKDGYNFEGWLLDNNLFNFKMPIKRDITLRAKWTKEAKFCDNICQDGYVLNSDCECIKNSTKTTKKTTVKKVINTTKKTTTTTKKVEIENIELSEERITIEEGNSARIDVLNGINVAWDTSDADIVRVDNGILKAVKSGYAVISATYENLVSKVYVRVITEDRARIDAVMDIMKSKNITKVGDNINYLFKGCTIVNDANITRANIRIENGIVKELKRGATDEKIVSSYKVVCGSEHENATVDHIVLGNK